MGKKIKTDVCVNGTNYKSVYITIDKFSDIHGNVIKTIKQTDFLELGCNLKAVHEQGIKAGLNLLGCKYKNPCIELNKETIGKGAVNKSKPAVSKSKNKNKGESKSKKIVKANKSKSKASHHKQAKASQDEQQNLV